MDDLLTSSTSTDTATTYTALHLVKNQPTTKAAPTTSPETPSGFDTMGGTDRTTVDAVGGADLVEFDLFAGPDILNSFAMGASDRFATDIVGGSDRVRFDAMGSREAR